MALGDASFKKAIIEVTKTVCRKISRLQATTAKTGVVIRPLAFSVMLHDSILKGLIENYPRFEKGSKFNDLDYKGVRWELKTNRGNRGECTINAVNVFENVRIIIINAVPENNTVFSIRLLDAKDDYFNPPQKGRQLRAMNEKGKKHAIQIYP